MLSKPYSTVVNSWRSGRQYSCTVLIKTDKIKAAGNHILALITHIKVNYRILFSEWDKNGELVRWLGKIHL